MQKIETSVSHMEFLLQTLGPFIVFFSLKFTLFSGFTGI